MVKDNGRDPRDPEYDDFGFSDFASDYIPDDDQLADFICDRPTELLELLRKNCRKNALADIQAWWIEENEDEIEREWEARNEPDPDEAYDSARQESML